MLTKLNLLNLYRKIYLIRTVENLISKNYSKNNMRCPVHLSIGQEACAVGLICNLNVEDKLYSNHRCHAHYLAKNGDLDSMIAEIHGKKNGCIGGVGGSMHLQDLRVNMVASIPIVSSAIALALGSALNQKRKKSKNITVVFIGDAALEEGIFHECANFASLHNLPILFACENNLFSVYTNIYQRQKDTNLTKYAKTFGIKYSSVDGNKIDKVVTASIKAINYVKSGNGPFFIQMNTYRYLEHCGPAADDHLKYRDIKELNFWKKRDPLDYFRKYLIKNKKFNLRKLNEEDLKIDKIVEHSFKKAEKSSFPSFKDAKKFVYASQ
jgi:pyruvate dehydrogenase E1 component alpha subunit